MLKQDNFFKKILVSIDGTESGIYALKLAVIMAQQLHAELHGIYVVDVGTLTHLLNVHLFIKSEMISYKEDLKHDGVKYINNAKQISAAKKVEIITSIKEGSVSKEVIKYTYDNNIDLIIVGKLQDILSRKDVFYDEGDKICRHAHVPVLIANDFKEINTEYKNL